MSETTGTSTAGVSSSATSSEGAKVASAEELRAALWPEGSPTPRRKVRCRHCGVRNVVDVPTAVLESEKIDCGACSKPLFLARDEPLEGLSARSYLHSLDRRSLDALRSIPGVPRLLRWTLKQIGDRSAKMLFMSDAILCNEEQFPELVGLVETARMRLDFPRKPTVFLGESPHMNALTTGVEQPLIVVRSSLLDQMGDDEIVAVLGHEIGHLQANHPLYSSMANLLLQGGATVWQALRFATLPLHRALLQWTRCAELTADRAGLLASRDLGACIRVLLTFAGGNRPGTSGRTQMKLAPFIEQCRDLAQLQVGHSLDSWVGGYLAMDRTHPHVAWRVMHLINWIEHGSYLTILSGEYLRRRGTESRRAGPSKASAASKKRAPTSANEPAVVPPREDTKRPEASKDA